MLARALAMVHSLALAAAVANPLPLPARIVMACAVMGSLVLSVRRFVWRPAVSAILVKPAGDWSLILSDGNNVAATVQPTTVITIWFTLLHLRTAGGRCTVLLCRDSLNAEGYRLLRVALKIGEVSGVPSA